MIAKSTSVAIIGASITGLTLAIALLDAKLYQAESITIYDLRSPNTPDPANSSGVILTPNGLKVLDALDILPRFADACWLSEYRTYKNERDETTRKTLIANESLYGYKNHRVWRRILLDVLREMLREKTVRIAWESKFDGIVHEDEEGVVFRINSNEVSASLLVGADGVHSSVRRYVSPKDGPAEFTGIAGVLSHIRWDSVDWPYPDYERACTIQGKPGALVLMPEDRPGSIIMVAMQLKMDNRSRQDWEALGGDKQFLVDFYARYKAEWESKTARAIIDSVCSTPDTLFMWPYLRMAPLKRWYSEKAAKVIILGDAAHALPPSSGQGVNQAMEDVAALTKLLSAARSEPKIELRDTFEVWQSLRQERVDAVFDWATNKTNVQRMPQAERETLVREGKAADAGKVENFDDMKWLYEPDTHQRIDEWIARKLLG
jgi:2-polyprenyl-6-methoxyphenol hydroxylase-like FAD-dependent oxidoreductase